MDETVDGGLMEGGRREMRDDLSLFGSVSCSVRDKHQNSKLDGKLLAGKKSHALGHAILLFLRTKH